MEENIEENKIVENDDSELSSLNTSSRDSESKLSFASQRKVHIDDGSIKTIPRILSSLNVRSFSPLQTFRPLSPATSLIIPGQNSKTEEEREINLLKIEIERLMASRENMANHIHNIENEKIMK